MILGPEKFWVWKNFGSGKNFSLEKCWDPKNYGCKIILGPKQFSVKKKFRDKKNLGTKNM